MLNLVLQEIAKSVAPVSLAALSQKLGVEPGALEGMLTYWVRKGRIKADDPMATAGAKCTGCCSNCKGAASCPFVARMPLAFSLRSEKDDNG